MSYGLLSEAIKKKQKIKGIPTEKQSFFME